MWEQVNTSYLAVNAAASSQTLIHSPYSFFNEVKKASQLFEGVAEATASVTKIFSGVLSDYLGRRKLLVSIGYGLAAVTKPLFPCQTILFFPTL